MMRIAIALTVLLTFTISVGQGQTKRIYTGADSIAATTTWVKYQRPGYVDRIIGFALDHDGGTGNLFVGFGVGGVVDTAAGKRMMLRPYESISWTGLSIDELWVRASSGTIYFRIRYW